MGLCRLGQGNPRQVRSGALHAAELIIYGDKVVACLQHLQAALAA
jgi:hypothetical protein